jgi:purine catabolism regulator
LAEAGIAGMIISVGGQFFQEIPEALIKTADERKFPLITIPWTTRFVDITRTVHEQLISWQYALLKQSDHIHQTLTQLVLEGGGIQELAETLADLVQRSVTIEDPQLNLLANANHGEIDRARERSIEAGETPPAIRELMQKLGILEKMEETLKPVFVPSMPEHGMTKERIAAPIIVGREIYGYMWLIANDEPHPLAEADRLAIERAAMVAAMIMLKDLAIHQTEARLQADVISQLLSGQTESLALKDKVRRLGLDLQQNQRVVLLRPPEDTLPSLRLADRLSQSIRKLTKKHIIQPLGQNMILILPARVEAKKLSRNLLELLPGLKIAIGRSAPALVHLAESYQEAEEALEIGLTLAPQYDLYDFDDLGFLHWLYHLPEAAREGNPYIRRIKALANDERTARAHLMQTLDVYLDCGGNAAETARMLNIHRNTLVYRLQSIEKICDVTLADPDVRLNLQIAIKAHYLLSQADTAQNQR